MTLQQFRYIIAIDRYRSFAQAALELDITQPTLSALLAKLENELGVRIFKRTNKTVQPTTIGEKIIRQAEKVLSEADKLTELVAEEKGMVNGSLSIAIGPTIAPYILPQFIKHYTNTYTGAKLTVNEMKADAMIKELQHAKIDVGIAISGNAIPGIKEIQLYTEPFWVYVSKDCLNRLPKFNPSNLEHEKMWIMKESQCMRDSAFSFCKARSAGKRIYEAGSLETLIRIVDLNGGFTIIPEMHLPFLSPQQRENIRPIEGNYTSHRSVSIYIRQDFIRERMLKSVIDTIARFIPPKMLNLSPHKN